MEVTLFSYAKLNLYLAVLRKRKDSYHSIKTLFERISLADKITLKQRRDNKIRVFCRYPGVPKDSSNLTYRSAKLLQDSFGIREGVDIKIIKRIPVASGLAGGSSNAAAVLLGLNRLWRLNLKQAQLAELAAKIGSDVSFFIYDTAFAEGSRRGEKIKLLRPLKGLRLWHILIVPKIKVSTRLIYKKWDNFAAQKALNDKRAGLTRPNSSVKMLSLALKRKDFAAISGTLLNDLQEVSVKLYPQIKEAQERLKFLGLKAISMSGSGPAVFGILSSRKEAESLYRHLAQEKNPWRVFIARTI